MILLSLYVVIFSPWLIQKLLVKDVRESDLYTRLMWPLIISWLYTKTDSFEILIIFFVLFVVLSVIDIAYAITFRGVFTSGAVEAIFLSNKSEISEFLSAYFKWQTLFSVIAYLTVSTLLFVFGQAESLMFLPDWADYLMLVIVGMIFYKGAVQKEFYAVLPGLSGMLPTYYFQLKKATNLINARSEKARLLDDISLLKNGDINQLVVVIGESSSPRHWSLYGYSRETTSLLEKYELVLFKDVVSPFTQTNPALSMVLTEADVENDLDPNESYSFIDLANKSGIETWWISNQEAVKSTPAAIAKTARHCYFSSEYNVGQHGGFDEFVLDPFEKALKSRAEKKIIVVHLMGSHLQYEHRYPSEKARFNDDKGISAYTDKLTKAQVNTINHYDNSIAYTDFILDGLINRLQHNNNKESALLFFSDHGEEVFDTRNFKGHEPQNVSRPMFEVPMFIWTDVKKKAFIKRLQENETKPLMLDDVFHSVLDLFEFPEKYLNKKRSFFSETFKPKKRLVYGKNFDEFFPKK